MLFIYKNVTHLSSILRQIKNRPEEKSDKLTIIFKSAKSKIEKAVLGPVQWKMINEEIKR